MRELSIPFSFALKTKLSIYVHLCFGSRNTKINLNFQICIMFNCIIAWGNHENIYFSNKKSVSLKNTVLFISIRPNEFRYYNIEVDFVTWCALWAVYTSTYSLNRWLNAPAPVRHYDLSSHRCCVFYSYRYVY